MPEREGINENLRSETPGVEGPVLQPGILSCERCGIPRSEWSVPTGVVKNSQIYCCQGCALDTGCTCEPAHHQN